jgi:hypothetical protein
MRLTHALMLSVCAVSVAAACSATDIAASESAPPTTERSSPTSATTFDTPTTTTTGPTTTAAAPGRPAPTTTKGAASARSAFLARAAEICRAMNRGMVELGERYPGGHVTTDQMIDNVRSTMGLSETMVRALRALPQPAGDAAGLNSLYAEVDQLNALMARMADAFEGHNAVSLLTLANQLGAKGKAVNQHFRDLGLDECGDATSSIAA